MSVSPEYFARRDEAQRLLEILVDRQAAGEDCSVEQLKKEHAHLAAEIQELADLCGEVQVGFSEQALRARQARREFDRILGDISTPRAFSERYSIESEVGKGGMGAVYRIVDHQLHRPLAMKLILGQAEAQSSGNTPQVALKQLARFLNEARITSQLQHPGIVPVHEIGVDGEGRAYFTMKFVRGTTLTKVLERRAEGDQHWNLHRTLGLILRTCESLAYAHEQGVIHRDVKPSNIMVGSHGEVYLMDWGIAVVSKPSGVENRPLEGDCPASEANPAIRDHGSLAEFEEISTWNETGGIVGTPPYMSPEQAMGQKHRLGPSTDVYAIGAILYEVLAGHPPYMEVRGQHPREVMSKICGGPPPRLSERMGPPDLLAIVEKAMNRAEEQRYPDAQELAQDIDRFMQGRVVTAYETGGWAEAKKWVARNKAWSATAALLLCVACATSVVSVVYGFRSESASKQYKSQLETTHALNAQLAASRRDAEEQAAAAKAKADEAEGSAILAKMKAQEAAEGMNDVLSLSVVTKLQQLIKAADRMWPASEELVSDYRTWIEHANKLLECSCDLERGFATTANIPTRLTERLERLRSQCAPLSNADRQRDREASAWYEALTYSRLELQWRRRMLGLEPWPQGRPVAASAPLTGAQTALQVLARSPGKLNPNGPHKSDQKNDVLQQLEMTERAMAQTNDEDRAVVRLEHARALFNVGRLDEAVSEVQTARSECSPTNRLAGSLVEAELLHNFERWGTAEGRASELLDLKQLSARVARLDELVDTKLSIKSDDNRLMWWHSLLEDAVLSLREFTVDVPGSSGLYSNGISGRYGWGILKRLEFASGIRNRTIESAEAKRKWAEALSSIAASDLYSNCAWPGGKLTPQIGILPLGRDPVSGLWEFWHLQSGKEPLRNEKGEFVPDEEMGIVLVLLPGANPVLGAQNNDPTGPNFDPGADPDEPIHTAKIAPMFVAKYEMTQGQWNMLCGRNPSNAKVGQLVAGGELITGLHPVESITWGQADLMMTWMGLRLLTEDEWEYACRAGTSTPWFTGSTAQSLSGRSNIADRSGSKGNNYTGTEWKEFEDGHALQMAVTETAPNLFGLCGMHDNVCEWTSSWYVDRYGTKSDTLKVWRGGSFYNPSKWARSAKRSPSSVTNSYINLGTRAARDVQP